MENEKEKMKVFSGSLYGDVKRYKTLARAIIVHFIMATGNFRDKSIINDKEIIDKLKRLNINGFSRKLKRIEVKDYIDKYGWERKGIYFVFNGRGDSEIILTIDQMQVSPLCKIADVLMRYADKYGVLVLMENERVNLGIK